MTPEYVLPEPGAYQLTLTLDPRDETTQARKNDKRAKSDSISVPDLSSELNFSKGPDSTALVQTEKDIEKYRKGGITLTVVNAAGEPRSGLEVQYTQTKHSFLFGIFYPAQNNRVDSLLKEAGINYAPVVFSWKDVEPKLGTYTLPPGRTSMLKKNGFAGMGHCLIFFWGGQPWATPDYIKQLSYDQFRSAVYPHIKQVVSAYKGDIKDWNVFNEPMFQYQNILGLTEKQTLEVIREATRAVRDADPKGQVLINNYNPGGEAIDMNPYDFMRDAMQAGVDFDTIGLELYYNGYTWEGGHPHARRTLFSMGELVDKYSTLGKAIQITEISVPSEPIGEGYWGLPWNQELQAEYLKTAYTIFFSKPQVEAIIWWDATDKTPGGNAFIYHGAILDEQNQPKKSYYVMKNLIRHWTTSGTGITDNLGRVGFRGYGGTYEISIVDPKTRQSKTLEIVVQEQKDNQITLTLD